MVVNTYYITMLRVCTWDRVEIELLGCVINNTYLLTGSINSGMLLNSLSWYGKVRSS